MLTHYSGEWRKDKALPDSAGTGWVVACPPAWTYSRRGDEPLKLTRRDLIPLRIWKLATLVRMRCSIIIAIDQELSSTPNGRFTKTLFKIPVLEILSQAENARAFAEEYLARGLPIDRLGGE